MNIKLLKTLGFIWNHIAFFTVAFVKAHKLQLYCWNSVFGILIWSNRFCKGGVFFLCRECCRLIKISTQVTLLSPVDYFRYLEVEWEVKRKTHREFSKTNMVDLCPKVPKQDNSSDCGVYLLQYVESFFQVCADTDFFFFKIHSYKFLAKKRQENVSRQGHIEKTWRPQMTP